MKTKKRTRIFKIESLLKVEDTQYIDSDLGIVPVNEYAVISYDQNGNPNDMFVKALQDIVINLN